MARQGNSEAVGLGWAYRKRRAADMARMPDGTPCYYCGQPMWKKTQKLHYDHIIPRAIGGKDGPCRITHAACNIRAGQRVRIRPRRRRNVRVAQYNRW
jgi:5-methylcytosine-specific restriction endonuclease McrA